RAPARPDGKLGHARQVECALDRRRKPVAPPGETEAGPILHGRGEMVVKRAHGSDRLVGRCGGGEVETHRADRAGGDTELKYPTSGNHRPYPFPPLQCAPHMGSGRFMSTRAFDKSSGMSPVHFAV